ncbi:hypothetical protein IFM89_016917 [Coptis chinensis]|uniref:Uncharacterized protein n=1 Tax=Coptis chinensis TaxID=261450 RepID=A0A835LW31_9MAGN|nr:hypothetical protein IFM89_016917 [Coptis chinensis]
MTSLLRQFSTEITHNFSIEEDAERKIGWIETFLGVGMCTVISYQTVMFFNPDMERSVQLLKLKNPLSKLRGAHELSRIAIDDERRKKILELGSAQGLLNMLEVAEDDRTRKEALKALFALSQSDEVALALYRAGANSVIRSISDSSMDAEVMSYKSCLLKKFQDLRIDPPSHDISSNNEWKDISF